MSGHVANAWLQVAHAACADADRPDAAAGSCTYAEAANLYKLAAKAYQALKQRELSADAWMCSADARRRQLGFNADWVVAAYEEAARINEKLHRWDLAGDAWRHAAALCAKESRHESVFAHIGAAVNAYQQATTDEFARVPEPASHYHLKTAEAHEFAHKYVASRLHGRHVKEQQDVHKRGQTTPTKRPEWLSRTRGST